MEQEWMEKRIKRAKLTLIEDMETVLSSLKESVERLKVTTDAPHEYVVNSYGELQALSAIINAKCGSLNAFVEVYEEMTKSEE